MSTACLSEGHLWTGQFAINIPILAVLYECSLALPFLPYDKVQVDGTAHSQAVY